MKIKDFKFEFIVREKIYPAMFNLNVMQLIQEEYGSIRNWGDLVEGENGEVDIKALKFGITEMINEAIDIENETAEVKKEFLTAKQVGRLITDAGIENMTKQVTDAVVESTKNETKN